MSPEEQAKIDAIKAKHAKTHKQYQSTGFWSKFKNLQGSDFGGALPQLDHTKDIDKLVEELDIKDSYVFKPYYMNLRAEIVLTVISALFFLFAFLMFNHSYPLGNNIKTFGSVFFFAGFALLFLWLATRWAAVTFDTKTQVITKRRGLFYLKFSSSWKFSEFKEIKIKEKSSTQNNTHYATSHYAIYLVHRNGNNIYIEDKQDGFEAMYAAKLVSKVTGIKALKSV